ncbi:hypothetical protein FGO68_gene11603 [Halteria grandinella]|uniref:Uncharacterized protein n=1 Tax=Halteria grandinella TaxID=5974 RepID=A0A8J8NQS3_HALGN|nr:hypothetical protein FGO68_gene11603 [Halteria grandinella]
MDSRTTFFGVFNHFSTRKFDTDYELSKKVLARGDQCEIRTILDRKSQENRTAKVYRKNELDERMLQLVKKEIETLSQLDHPNITKVHAVYEDDFKLYIIVDNVKGTSLFEKIIKAGQLPEAEAAMIIQRVLCAARYLHMNGLVHRNLRPELILFENETSLYDLKILDLVTMVEALPEGSTSTPEMDKDFERLTKGCPIYQMAPELLRLAEREFAFKCDVWSCGVMLYNMITGIPPFFENNANLTMSQIRSGIFSNKYPNYEESKNLPLKNLITSMLQTSTEHRINAYDATKHEWVLKHVSYPPVSKKVAYDALNNIKNLQFTQQLQRSILMYMVKLQLDKKDRDTLVQLFETIDEDKDGMIDAQDIATVYGTKYAMQLSEQDISRIRKQLDVSKASGITITEFLLGACNKSTLINEPNLRSVFHYIDGSAGGFITRKELMSFLGVNDETYIGLIMEEADDDCDGGLNMKEFINFMMRLSRLSI